MHQFNCVHDVRWLKGSGVSLPSEKQQRCIATNLLDDNMDGEIAPFSSILASGGEELRGAVHVFIPNISRKRFQLL